MHFIALKIESISAHYALIIPHTQYKLHLRQRWNTSSVSARRMYRSIAKSINLEASGMKVHDWTIR